MYMGMYDRLENYVEQKTFKIHFFCTNKSNILCVDLQTPFQLFWTLRVQWEHENSRSLLGAKIGFQNQLSEAFMKDSCYFCLYELENDLEQKIFKIQFFGTDKSNILFKDLKTHFQQF